MGGESAEDVTVSESGRPTFGRLTLPEKVEVILSVCGLPASTEQVYKWLKVDETVISAPEDEELKQIFAKADSIDGDDGEKRYIRKGEKAEETKRKLGDEVLASGDDCIANYYLELAGIE